MKEPKVEVMEEKIDFVINTGIVKDEDDFHASLISENGKWCVEIPIHICQVDIFMRKIKDTKKLKG